MNFAAPLMRCLTALAMLSSVTLASADSVAPETQPAGGNALRVYVGTYTGPKSKGIYLYRFDLKTGALSASGLAAETDNPAFLAAGPSGDRLYAANEISKFRGEPSGAVSAFSISPHTGMLTLLNQQPSGGVGPCYVSIDPQGRNALVANYTNGSVAVLPIETDGRLSPPAAIEQHAGSGPNRQRQENPHAHSIAPDLTGRFALSADLGTDRLYLYRFEPKKSALTPGDPPAANLTPGAGPRHFALHPTGRYVYVINELNSTVTALASDFNQGSLREIQTLSTLPEGFKDVNYPADLHVHPGGKFLYGSNRGHDSIAIFSIDPHTGRLALVGHEPTRGQWPRNFAIDPTGEWLIAANQKSDSLAVFGINTRTGRLTPTGELVEAPAPTCVLFMPAVER